MSSAAEDLFAFESEDPNREIYERRRRELHEFAADFADEHDLSFAMMSLLLMDLAVTSRQIDYVMSVEKPSGSGMRLELDRFHREVGEFMRSTKKSADRFVQATKNALAQADALAEEEGPAQPLPDQDSPR